MLKKIAKMSFGLVLCSAMGLVNAAPYIGISAGSNKGNWNLTDVNGNKLNFGGTSYTTSLFGGYGDMIYQAIYLGTEVAANLGSTGGRNLTIATSSGLTTGSLKQSYGYGISMLPAFVIYPGTFIFARIAIVRSHFQVNSANATFNKSKNLNGKQGGLGIEHTLAGCFDIRAEYDITNYNPFNLFGQSMTPHNKQILVGLVYKMS
ncbi:MAG: outer membrane beta-barrel protein [Gammaproteobacteria bacterium]|nr:outer membrane beta-barrel protein [Gammaproteobacteria bacterium]